MDTEPRTHSTRMWLRTALALVGIAFAVSLGKAASADWVLVASCLDVQVFVDAGSVTKD